MVLTRREFVRGGVVAAGTLALPARAMELAPRLSDVQVIIESLQLHPGLNRYILADTTIRALQRIDALWPIQDTRTRFLTLGRILADIRCGHSYPNFFNQRRTVQEQLFGNLPRVPFAFRWIGATGQEAMVVTGDAGGQSGLPPGTIIIRLNGRRPREILRTLLPLTRADGGNNGKRRALLEMRADDGFETFDIYHGLTFGGTASDPIRVQVRLPDGRTAQSELASATLTSRTAAVQATPTGNDPAWQWTMRPDGIAVLTMNGWALYNSSWDWRSWLDERLASLSANGRLIIDIRNNEGGLDCGDHILARLTDRDLNFAAYERRVRFRRTPDALNPYLDTWDHSFRTLGANAEDIGGGFYRLPAGDGTGRLAARGPRLDARVAVLTSAVNSSATFGFAQRCKETGLARLFGETTGGNRRGINGGAFFFVRLPESGLEFDLPLIGTFPTTPQPDAGIVPDVAVANTAADIADGHDRVLGAAVNWLNLG